MKHSDQLLKSPEVSTQEPIVPPVSTLTKLIEAPIEEYLGFHFSQGKKKEPHKGFARRGESVAGA